MDYRTLLYRAIGVPDAVVDKTEAAAWMVLSGAGLESHDRVDLLLRRLHDGTAAAVVDDIVLRLEAGEFDPLFVHRPGTTVDEIAEKLACTREAVYARRSRIRAELREAMKEFEGLLE